MLRSANVIFTESSKTSELFAKNGFSFLQLQLELVDYSLPNKEDKSSLKNFKGE